MRNGNARRRKESLPEFELAVSAFAFGGEGIGRLPDGKVCFVFGAAPGDVVRVALETSKKNYARGRLLEISAPSASRIEPDCPYASTCPGCAYRHVAYSCELAWKQRQFQSFLLRGGALAKASAIRRPVGAPTRTGYRNKLTFACGNGRFCYRGSDNRTAVPVAECLLGHDAIRALMRSAPAPADGRCVFRWTERDGALRSDTPEWSARGSLTESLDGFGEFQVAPDSFFQTNPAMASRLARAVVSAASGLPNLIELFSGVGVFSILAAEENPALRSVGVESDPLARPFAERNAASHGVAERCSFLCADAERAFSELASRSEPDRTCVLLDPPRTGISANLAAALAAFSPARIVYVSCSADTLRRDLERIVPSGYGVASAEMFDMFPGTAHFESLTILERETR